MAKVFRSLGDYTCDLGRHTQVHLREKRHRETDISTWHGNFLKKQIKTPPRSTLTARCSFSAGDVLEPLSPPRYFALEHGSLGITRQFRVDVTPGFLISATHNIRCYSKFNIMIQETVQALTRPFLLRREKYGYHFCKPKRARWVEEAVICWLEMMPPSIPSVTRGLRLPPKEPLLPLLDGIIPKVKKLCNSFKPPAVCRKSRLRIYGHANTSARLSLSLVRVSPWMSLRDTVAKPQSFTPCSSEGPLVTSRLPVVRQSGGGSQPPGLGPLAPEHTSPLRQHTLLTPALLRCDS
ncbi:hypothetical protein EYF80_015394 [Liparis tanakae]|uniref:Uncharacterized protein n=1 Tax=Liparis tanakae TaxID=230148 RepID=A0A4Z2IAJ7_9TELE|nr:hypothetical protein EYF80_015394 [Liparis tanakae]